MTNGDHITYNPKFSLDEKALYALKTEVTMAVCFFCQKTLTLDGKVSFRELCPHCGMDVHVCRNCNFYDPGRANNCREPMAEKVRDPEVRNTCEYFTPGMGEGSGTGKIDQAKAALENLFKKK